MTVKTYKNRHDALAAETLAIQRENPRYNVAKRGKGFKGRDPDPVDVERAREAEILTKVEAAKQEVEAARNLLSRTKAEAAAILEEAARSLYTAQRERDETLTEIQAMRDATQRAREEWAAAKSEHDQWEVLMRHTLWQRQTLEQRALLQPSQRRSLWARLVAA